MFFDAAKISELVILNLILIAIILFLVFRWFFKEVRSICREPEGIIKFGQVTFILLSWGCFLFIMFYFVIRPEQVGVLNIFLTIVVGFLGTILGLFFSREMIEKLKEISDHKTRSLMKDKVFLEDVEALVKENIWQKEEVNRLRKKLQ